MAEGSYEHVDGALAAAIIQSLVPRTEGPRQAYALLALAIWMLNFEISDEPATIDELCNEVCASLRSIQPKRRANA